MNINTKRFAGLFFALPLGCAASFAAASEVSSTFDTDLDGWVSSAGGTASYMATGGNPGGFLRQSDADLSDMVISAPAVFLGDKSSFLGGTFSFDAIDLDGVVGDYSPFGLVILRSNNFTISADIVADNNPTAAWTTYSVTLNAASFGVSEAEFAEVLTNLVGLDIGTESRIGVLETVGVDNIRLVSVPGASSLAAMAVPFVLAARRRR